MLRILPLIVLTLTLAACSGPTEPPLAHDPPPLAAEDRYITHVEGASFAGSLAEIRAFMEDPGVLSFTEPTPRIPGIVEITPLDGTFPDTGATRRLAFADGSFVVERVVQNRPGLFQYQVWNLTSGSGRAVDHILGAFRYEPRDDGTIEVIWTYRILPRFGLVRPFVRSFVENDIAPFMESGLDGAAAAFNASR